MRTWRTERARRDPGTPVHQAPERSEERRWAAGPERAEGFLGVVGIDSSSEERAEGFQSVVVLNLAVALFTSLKTNDSKTTDSKCHGVQDPVRNTSGLW